VRVHVVGSSGTFPAPGRPATGFVIEHQGTRIWSDAGPGTFISLPVDPDLIDAVVLSHQHPDHCADIFAAFHAWTYRPEPRHQVPLYAPQPVWDRIVGFTGRDPECFAFTPVSTGGGFEWGTLSVEFVEMDHSVPTVGSLWTGASRTMFYTADTGPEGNWRGLAEGADLLLCEASYQGTVSDKEYPHHLTAGEAGEIARGIGARVLTLTHIPPYLDPAVSVSEAERTFGRQVRLAVPGTNFDV
jgi:ribonuclease BN (tRNA processing enzyme)